MVQTKTFNSNCANCDEETEWVEPKYAIPRLFFDSDLDGLESNSLIKVGVCTECGSVQQREIDEEEVEQRTQLLENVVEKLTNNSD